MDSEDAFLACIDRHFPREHGHVLLGRGDDCAIVRAEGSLCLSTDLFLEDVHFRRHTSSPEDIGHKALAVNLSDIAAMGGIPLGFSLGLVIPTDPGGLDDAFWEACFRGMASLASETGVSLTGGDLSRGPLLGFCVTIWGRPGPSGRLLPRGPVRPGMALAVLGDLGLSRQGLRLLEENHEARHRFPASLRAHRAPRPLLEAGLALAATPGVAALMDVSDGLARDLPRMLALGHAPGQTPGASLRIDPALLHPELLAAQDLTGSDPVLEAVLGGEDYALLAAGEAEALRGVPGAMLLGVVEAEPGVRCNGAVLAARGFDHFQTGAPVNAPGNSPANVPCPAP